jgi:FkbM family methyltransferase
MSDSLVYDVGGYTGEWAHIMHHKYCARIEIFEPVSQFVSVLQQRFENNRKITINHYGVSGHAGAAPIALLGDGSSVFKQENRTRMEICQFKAIDDVLREKGDQQIALMAINIEGAEYDLLDKLLDTEKHTQIDNILIQFHKVSSDSSKRRRTIQERLKSSHYQTFSYDYIWENWRLRSNASTP